jgi:cold shock CspA family protein
VVGGVAVGRILRFDDVRGYGFIEPSSGGEDVFVHANDFGDQRHLVRAGMQVEYEAEESDRGLKVVRVRFVEPLAPASGPPAERRSSEADGRPRVTSAVDDDGLCDVLARREYVAEVTELLVQHVPSLTGAQIVEVRRRLADLARSHGWLES